MVLNFMEVCFNQGLSIMQYKTIVLFTGTNMSNSTVKFCKKIRGIVS